MTCKVIIQGWLEFGSQKRFDKVQKMLIWRAETHYKNESLLDPEIVFDEESKTLHIGRLVEQATRKSWNNTVSLLEYAAEFAISGKIEVWIAGMAPNRHHFIIEPKSDRDVVVKYKEGKQLLAAKKAKEAIVAFEEVIGLYSNHFLAYLGLVDAHLLTSDRKQAALYIDKARSIRDNDPGLYMRSGLLSMHQNKHEEAVEAFSLCTRFAIALQPVYWRARFHKGLSHMALEQWQEAAKEFNFFIAKTFDKKDENVNRIPEAHFRLAQCFVHLEQFKQAVKSIDTAESLDKQLKSIPEAQFTLYKGLARKGAGLKDYQTYLKKAASVGSEQAARLLENSLV